MPPRTNLTPTKFHFRNCGCTAGRKSIKSDKMVLNGRDLTFKAEENCSEAKKMVDYSDEDTVTREKAITMPRKGGKDKKTIDNIDNSDEDMAVSSPHKAGKYQKVIESSDDETNLASRVSGRTAAKIASAKLKDVFMDNDSDVEQSLESDAALPINEPEMETPKKKANKAFVLLPTPISPSPNKGKATHTPIKRVYVSDSDKDAQLEQSSPIRKVVTGRHPLVSNQIRQWIKGKTEDVLKAIMKDGKMEINNEDTDEGEENFECQVTSITLMDAILLKADAYETLPPFRRAYYAITYQPINTLTFTGVLDGFMGYQVNKPALIKASAYLHFQRWSVRQSCTHKYNYQMTGSLESQLGAHQLAITFGAVTFSAVAASRMIPSMSKWTKDINIAPMSLEWERTLHSLAHSLNSVTMSTRPSSLEHPDYVGNSGSTSLNKMLSKASPSKAVAGRHGGPSTSVDEKCAASFILPQGKVPSTLDHWDDVVVYDCTAFFQGIESCKQDNKFSFNSVHDTCPRWNNEDPLGSFVAVLYSPGQYKTKLGTDSDGGLYLVEGGLIAQRCLLEYLLMLAGLLVSQLTINCDSNGAGRHTLRNFCAARLQGTGRHPLEKICAARPQGTGRHPLEKVCAARPQGTGRHPLEKVYAAKL
ncbi:hypothetical protein BKA93DRAFT_853932 [Sparassis latifolia]